METLESFRLIAEVFMAIIAAGGLKSWISNRKYRQEVEKLKADIQATKINTRGDELENVKTAMDILMEQIIEPLKKEINGIRKEVIRLRKAVEKANDCPHFVNCPVRDELQKSERIDTDYPERQPAKHKKIRDDPDARSSQLYADQDSDRQAGESSRRCGI